MLRFPIRSRKIYMNSTENAEKAYLNAWHRFPMFCNGPWEIKSTYFQHFCWNQNAFLGIYLRRTATEIKKYLKLESAQKCCSVRSLGVISLAPCANLAHGLAKSRRVEKNVAQIRPCALKSGPQRQTIVFEKWSQIMKPTKKNHLGSSKPPPHEAGSFPTWITNASLFIHIN